MIFDITDPKCDVEKLFIDFLKFYDEEIIHCEIPTTWSLSKYNVLSWLELYDDTLMSDKYANELISAWNQAGFIKRDDSYKSSDGVYAFTTKGLKLKRRKH